ncbi:phage tail protein [Paenibacillus sp. USDA918EY]|uniref:phage tail protein n=1 Tax=Paenibacillus sp. USDA918EY TaxID=2689575 RepID=UPI0005420DA1|nr:phage tail protein [Paenibacillus sp. USDA918EY]KHF33395.1 Phage P2 GpU [Paenibacillus sp. P1XP2]
MALPDGVGVLGDIVFIVTSYKVRTFESLTRTSNDRWANNDIIHKKPRSQFLGPGLDTFDLTVRVDARLGLNPRAEVDKLVKYSREGKVMKFTVGGKGMGVDRVKIISLTQNWERLDNRGNLISATYSLTLEEYV